MLLKLLDEPQKNFTFLDYEMHSGTLDGKRVTVGNGGRYAPDTAITTEILCGAGARGAHSRRQLRLAAGKRQDRRSGDRHRRAARRRHVALLRGGEFFHRRSRRYHRCAEASGRQLECALSSRLDFHDRRVVPGNAGADRATQRAKYFEHRHGNLDVSDDRASSRQKGRRGSRGVR